MRRKESDDQPHEIVAAEISDQSEQRRELQREFPASQRYAIALVSMRVIFGFFWLIDGYLKLQPGMVQAFPGLIKSVAAGQPSWLQGWFSFWESTTAANASPAVYSIAILELALGSCLVLGVMRKLAYIVSFFYSLVIWSVPEGFGGPYGPGSTDIGTGVVYALASLLFLLIIGIFGPSPYSLDFQIEKRFPAWKRFAELKKIVT
jgi:nitrite reductase (NO-forming)